MARLNQWVFEPWTVHGGFKVAVARWFIDRHGEKDHEHEIYDPTLYPTWGECVKACANLINSGAVAQPR